MDTCIKRSPARSLLRHHIAVVLSAAALGVFVMGCDTLGDIAGMAGAMIPGGSQIVGLSQKTQQILNTSIKVANTVSAVSHVAASILDDKQQSAVGIALSEEDACTAAQGKLSDNGPCQGAPDKVELRPCTCTGSGVSHICHAAAVYTCAEGQGPAASND